MDSQEAGSVATVVERAILLVVWSVFVGIVVGLPAFLVYEAVA